MKYHFYVLRLKKLFLYGISLTLIGLLIANSQESMIALRDALFLCSHTVIPSLFPFFVLSSFLSACGFAHTLSRLLSPVMKPLFRLPGAAALPFVMGILSGYPVGAKTALALYQHGDLSRDEARRLLPFSNNSGPLFLIGAVGTAMLGDTGAGLYLYGVHLAAALILGVLLRFFAKDASHRQNRNPAKKSRGNLGAMLSDAVTKSTATMVSICGFILFFAALSTCLAPLLRHLPSPLSLILQGLLEITKGADTIITSQLPLRHILALLSFFIGFGGFCVALQVAGILAGSGLSMKSYFLGKLLQGFFAGLLAYFCYPLLGSQAAICPVFAKISVQNSIFSDIMFIPGQIVSIFFLIVLFINYKKYRVK